MIETVRSLARNRSLARLNLSNTKIGNDTAKVLVQSMRTNTTLKGLNLSDNLIEDEGCKYIAKVF